MSGNKFRDIEICQIVGMRDKKRAGGEPFAIHENCAARAQEFVFMNEIDSIAERRPRNVIAHDVGEPMRVDQHAFNVRGKQRLQPVIKQRFILNRHQTFWGRQRQGP
jgi:hypothetical protein